MEPSGPRSNESSTSGMPSTSASSYLSFSPSEYGNFKGQVTHQIMVLQRMYQELKNSFSIEQSKTQQLMNTITAIQGQSKPVAEKMANLQKFVAKITDENSKLKKGIEDQGEGSRKVNEESKAEVLMLKTMIESLTRSVDENRLRTASSGSSSGGASNFVVPPDFSEIISVLEQQMGSYDMKFAEMDLRFQVIETTNYDGKIIWKIRDFRRRRDDAKRGGALSIYSQPFYTSRYGYKMCLRIYLNGDGMGRNTHISLFFVLMKGEYDGMLPFPFKQKVSLFMLDQSPQRRHLSDTFRPDPASSSFKKPNSDMNIASGCPMFVAHDALNNTQYVVDDTIFIRAVIDTTDLENF